LRPCFKKLSLPRLVLMRLCCSKVAACLTMPTFRRRKMSGFALHCRLYSCFGCFAKVRHGRCWWRSITVVAADLSRLSESFGRSSCCVAKHGVFGWRPTRACCASFEGCTSYSPPGPHAVAVGANGSPREAMPSFQMVCVDL